MTTATDEAWNDWTRDFGYSIRGRLSPKTVEVYLRGLRQFRAHLAGHHPEVTGPEDVQRRHVESWLASLAETGLAAATRRVRLMGLRTFFGWLAAEPGVTLANPTTGVQAPEVPMPPSQVIPDETLAKVLATCVTGSFVDLRDMAILRTLLACGLRREELCRLDLDDVDLNGGVLNVLGKGNKRRLVSLSGTKTALALSRYLRVRRRHAGAKEAAFFLSTRPDRSGSYRLSGGGVAEMLKRRCVLADVPVFGPHALRHSWAHANKESGLSDEDLERMGGWSTPGMVRRYGRALADQRAMGAHARLGVGDRV